MPFCPLSEQNGKSWSELLATCKITSAKTTRNSHNTSQIFSVYVKKTGHISVDVLEMAVFPRLAMVFACQFMLGQYSKALGRISGSITQHLGSIGQDWAVLRQDLGSI